MKVDMRIHPPIRDQVHAGLSALRVQGRQIWGDEFRQSLPEITIRMIVGIGDIARVARDSSRSDAYEEEERIRQVKKELGNILFSTIRWIDDLGLDVLECLDLAIEAQEKFAGSGRPR
jgi:hypothetical protein